MEVTQIKKSSALFRYWRWLHTGPFATAEIRSTFEGKLESASTCSLWKDISRYSVAALVIMIIFLIVICLMMSIGNVAALLILVIGWLFGYGPNRVTERLAIAKHEDGFFINLVLLPVVLICSVGSTKERAQEIPGMRKLNLPRLFGIPIYPIYPILVIASVYFTLGAIEFFSSLATRPEELETLGYIGIVIGGVLGFFGLLALWKSSFGLLARTYIKDRLKGLCREIEFVDE